MKLVLLGYMGSGKSAVGKALAPILDMPFLDLDMIVEERTGQSISKLFDTRGEVFFRRQEHLILMEILQDPGSSILALGGGTPCYGDTMTTLNKQPDVCTVYLKTSNECLTSRLFPERSKRPLIAHLHDKDALKDFIRKHLFERSHFYNQAELTINAETKSIDEIAELIVLHLF